LACFAVTGAATAGVVATDDSSTASLLFLFVPLYHWTLIAVIELARALRRWRLS
jgi:hypothetical protein